MVPIPSLNRSAIRQDSLPETCNVSNINYPFGIPGVSLHEPKDGFEIFCGLNTSGEPTVRIGKDYVRVLNISLDGQIRVYLKAFASRCSKHALEESQVPGQVAVPDLQGTPYTFSNSVNKLIVIGCDALALLQAPGMKAPTGCTSFCFSIDGLIEGSCSGVGCCQAAIPPGLKSFTLEFKSIRNVTGAVPNLSASKSELELNTTQVTNNSVTHSGVGYGTCSKAFIRDPNNFKFSKDELNRDGNQDMEVVLDWYIDNKTCGEASKATDSFACVAANSDCYNVPGGYRCSCGQGHQGNPYLKDGCEDIDECSTGEHDCEHRCSNTKGAYECRCPIWTRGDGKRNGSGCKRVGAFPLDIGLGMGLGFLIILCIISSLSHWAFKKNRIQRLKQKYFQQNGGLLLQQHISSQVATIQVFTEEELEFATNGFHESRVIGRGGYGTVYKGILLDERPVAIKRSKQVDESQIEQFINEVVILSQIKHKNVVKILGCCLETQVPLLVYQFIPNGTLFQHLHTVKASATSPMNWETRLRIAVETAAALAYLHGVASIPIIHRDVKSANILLDENYTAKVADFGASRLVPCNRTHVTTLVQGTLGYLDPEYFHTSLLTEKSDVYSFGVVLVELLTRENPVSFCRSDEERNLAFHFISLVDQNRLIDALDKETVEEAGTRQLLAVAQLAKRCLNVRGEERPTMREVAVELEALRRLMHHHFVQEGKVYQTSPSTSLAISDSALPDSMKSMENHLLSGPSSSGCTENQ
ncbi:hypothetical protein J5N97_018847 [Dioscorea zingiberensis]|uniref:Protein kinase domain-containing protein n=1 Tax=Dioscorea zingiberensis TaxID=325984 RepID=A0A9D5CCV7_9LILI|nr:hypothetical protein J5N97_018847 [Dioscorea zingiberensis]